MNSNNNFTKDSVTRVKLKLCDLSKPKPTKNAVISELFTSLNLPLVRLIDQTDSFIAITRNSEDTDKLMSEKAKTSLNKLFLEAIDHPKLKAKRTLVFKKVDPYVGEKTAEEIENEITQNQTWAKVRQVIKIKNFTHIFKVEFNDSKIADKVLNDGLLLFNMAISPTQIDRENYIDIVMCFKCYALEHHYTAKCPTPTKIICSDCSADTHTFKDCTNNNKKCINCNENHKTTSMACPKRKEIVNRKLKQQNSDHNSNKTYAAVAHANNPQAGMNYDFTMSGTILACIIHAHIINSSAPGTYNATLKDMFARNNLPAVEFPTNPPSGKILGTMMGSNVTLFNQQEMQTDTATYETESDNESISSERSNKRKRTETDHSAPNKYTTEQLGVIVYCTKTNKPTSSESLKQALLHGKVRWKSDGKYNLKHEDLIRYAENDRLILTAGSVRVVTYNELNKIPIQQA